MTQTEDIKNLQERVKILERKLEWITALQEKMRCLFE